MNSTELVLTESATLRSQYISRVEVLDRVKALTMLPGDTHATTEIVAGYLEVEVDALRKVVERNRAELEAHGYRVVRGQEMKELVSDIPSLTKVRALALFTRQTILNIAMMLTGSEVTKAIRAYLLKIEEQATPEARAEAVEAIAGPSEIERAAVARAQIEMLGAAVSTGLLDKLWATGKTHVIAARALGEQAELPEALKPLYVPDFIKSKGVKSKKDITSIQSWFGRRVVQLCEAAGVEVPEKRPRELLNEEVRDTRAWRVEHLPYFEQVWDTYYAADYDPPMFMQLDGAA